MRGTGQALHRRHAGEAILTAAQQTLDRMLNDVGVIQGKVGAPQPGEPARQQSQYAQPRPHEPRRRDGIPDSGREAGGGPRSISGAGDRSRIYGIGIGNALLH